MTLSFLPGLSLHCPGVAQNVGSRHHVPCFSTPPWEGVKDWMSEDIPPGCLRKAMETSPWESGGEATF